MMKVIKNEIVIERDKNYQQTTLVKIRGNETVVVSTYARRAGNYGGALPDILF